MTIRSDILSDIIWHSIWYFLELYSNILSGILSSRMSNTHFGIFPTHIYLNNLSDILSGLFLTYIQAFYLAFFPAVYLTIYFDILSKFYPTCIMAFYISTKWFYILSGILCGIYSDIPSCMLSGTCSGPRAPRLSWKNKKSCWTVKSVAATNINWS